MNHNLYLIGLNHKTAPLDKREGYLQQVGAIPEALERLKKLSDECVILNTCNRFEIIYMNDSPIELSALAQGWKGSLEGHCYQLHGLSAVQHLYEVAASLDSMVLGETEILGQVRSAYELAQEHDCIQDQFHNLFQGAIAAAKKIHSETGIGQGHVSVGSVAVDLCRQVYSHLNEKNILLLGSGDIGRVVLKNLKAAGSQNIKISSRTLDNALSLAKDLGGSTVEWGSWQEHLVLSDILITAASTPESILSLSELEGIQKKRKRRPLLIVDLSVPRNVATEVDKLQNVYRYDMDGLSEIIDNNSASRQALISDCRLKLTEDVQKLFAQNSSREMGQIYKQLDSRLSELEEEEFQKIKNQIPEDLHDLFRQSLKRFGNKILHPLKKNAPEVIENKEDLEKILFGEQKK